MLPASNLQYIQSTKVSTTVLPPHLPSFRACVPEAALQLRLTGSIARSEFTTSNTTCQSWNMLSGCWGFNPGLQQRSTLELFRGSYAYLNEPLRCAGSTLWPTVRTYGSPPAVLESLFLAFRSMGMCLAPSLMMEVAGPGA